MRVLHLDVETYSGVDITKAGVYKYCESSDFELLMLAWSFDAEPVQIVDVKQGEQIPAEVLRALTDPEIIKIAHNATFERLVFRAVGIDVPVTQFRCSATKAAYCGLPLSLGAISSALSLGDKGKMSEGKALIRLFCIPCKPTKKNGGRTRNLPEHFPEKWQMFKDYCVRDVEAEQEIWHLLEHYTIPHSEQVLYRLDQKINDRGVLIDLELARAAQAIDNAQRAQLLERQKYLTCLPNPNSASQLKDWISAAKGRKITSLAKADLQKLIDEESDASVREVLVLRQKASRTSTKKYVSMQVCACDDGRARGLFKFYGASRTGRWAGRLIQLQNLKRNYIDGLETAREAVKTADLGTFQMMYKGVTDTLSQLIRTALIASPGHTFAVADFSAIEARVIAWLAGEKWRLEVFNTHGKIYEASAAKMFGVPIESIGKGSDLRAKGKVAELACIAHGEPVLTNRGLVPIQEVLKSDYLWDGVQFVPHEGVIFRGTKKVMSYDGLKATPDHIVFTEEGPTQFFQAYQRELNIIRTGAGRNTLRYSRDNNRSEGVQLEMGQPYGFLPLHQLREGELDKPIQSQERKVERMPKMQPASKSTYLVGEEGGCHETTLRNQNCPELSKLWRAWDRVQIYLRFGRGFVDNAELRPRKVERLRQDKQQRALRGREFKIRNETKEYDKREDVRTERSRFNMGRERKPLPPHNNETEIVGRTYAREDNIRSESGSSCEAEELERYFGEIEEVRVYDILNAGPRNRFTVSDKLVHNCGYQGGVGALKAMGGEAMGLSESDMKASIDAWRLANPKIVELWQACEHNAKRALHNQNKTVVSRCGRLKFRYDGLTLRILLPSGRALFYYEPTIKENRFGRPGVVYKGVNQHTRKWGYVETYGGKIVENIVQAIARDLMAYALLKLDAAGFDIVMHVHDEAACEVLKGDAADKLEEMTLIMGAGPQWSKGLPLGADGYITPFYKKD